MFCYGWRVGMCVAECVNLQSKTNSWILKAASYRAVLCGWRPRRHRRLMEEPSPMKSQIETCEPKRAMP